jgi:hypothetical protein
VVWGVIVVSPTCKTYPCAIHAYVVKTNRKPALINPFISAHLWHRHSYGKIPLVLIIGKMRQVKQALFNNKKLVLSLHLLYHTFVENQGEYYEKITFCDVGYIGAGGM